MQFKENAEVLTSDGRKVGRIDRVVIDPKTKMVTHLVVKKGFLFTRDKVVPLDDVGSTTEEQVILNKKAGKQTEFLDFEETHHVPVEYIDSFRKQGQEGYARPLVWHYPNPGIGWWGEEVYPRYPRPQYIVKTEQNVPPGTVPLQEGAKVVSANGDHVGDVERIFADPEEHRATHLLISKGMLLKEKKLIPTPWVDSVFENEVRLAVESDLIRGLPVYDLDLSAE